LYYRSLQSESTARMAKMAGWSHDITHIVRDSAYYILEKVNGQDVEKSDLEDHPASRLQDVLFRLTEILKEITGKEVCVCVKTLSRSESGKIIVVALARSANTRENKIRQLQSAVGRQY
jgi:hypothetical protein